MTINYAARINKVADAIEQAIYNENTRLGFNMGYFWLTKIDPRDKKRMDMTGHSCGTVACIAGWTNKVSKRLSLTKGPRRRSHYNVAKEWLGLDDITARLLFVPLLGLGIDNTPARTAVAVLRKFAKTGEIDWTARYRKQVA